MDCELIPGKVALVTGSTRGMGRAIARRLALSGADVILHDVDPSQAGKYGEASGPDEVVSEMEELGRRAAVFFGDLTDTAAVAHLAQSALEHFGRVDVLVNNAGGDIGVSGAKPVPNECLEIPDEDLRVILDRNLVSVMNVTRALAPQFIERGDGSIINIASIAGLIPCPEGSIYAVAKAGVVHWTRCLAEQMRPHGVNVNAVAPGDTRTGRFVNSRYVPPERLNETRRLMRLGEPDDIAKAVLFFASDLSVWISGQTLVVNGGSRGG
jgi:3-oxoacyl-[acyl-carrier protein] reductase